LNCDGEVGRYAAGVAFVAKYEKFKEAIEATFTSFGVGDGDGPLNEAEA
jgi:hypothetical protein